MACSSPGVGADRGDFLKVLGAMFARGLGWLFLGLAVGMSEGIAARSLGKFSYGAARWDAGRLRRRGHLLPALSGFSERDPRQRSGAVWGAMGLVILGRRIGSLSALVQRRVPAGLGQGHARLAGRPRIPRWTSR